MADDRHLLDRLYQAGTLAFTPSASYDDRYVLQYAQTCGGIVVSNDQYNDIKNERLVLSLTKYFVKRIEISSEKISLRDEVRTIYLFG